MVASASLDDTHELVPRSVAAAVVVGLTLWVALDRYRYLAGSPYPFGVDGYFYAVQLRSLLGGHGLAYPAAPLTFWWMAPFAALSDPIVGAKLGAAIASALAVPPAFAVGRRLGGARVDGLVAAVIVATSAESFYLTTEFAKTAVGLALLLAYLAALLAAIERPSHRQVALAALALVATLLGHKLAFALAVLLSLAPLARSLRRRAAAASNHRRWWPIALGAGLAAGAAVVALGVAAPARFLAGRDLALLAGLVRRPADWSLPVLSVGPRQLHFGHEVTAAAACAVALAIAVVVARLVRGRAGGVASDGAAASASDGAAASASDGAAASASDGAAAARALLATAAGLALFLALPWLDVSDPDGLAFRLRLVAFVPLALLAAALAGRLRRPLAARTSPLIATALLAGFAVGLVVNRAPTYEAPVVRADPDMARAVARLAAALPADVVVIVPERHILFMAAWYAGADVRLRPDGVAAARRVRLVPMAYMSDSLIAAIDRVRAAPPPGLAPPVSLHSGHPDGLVLMTEATWQAVLAALPAGERQHFEAWPTY